MLTFAFAQGLLYGGNHWGRVRRVKSTPGTQLIAHRIDSLSKIRSHEGFH